MTPEKPLLDDKPVDDPKADPITRWVNFVNQEQPMSQDATDACRIINDLLRPPYELRAFWHENYGQWWVHPKNHPGRQLGCVFPFTLEAWRVEQEAQP